MHCRWCKSPLVATEIAAHRCGKIPQSEKNRLAQSLSMTDEKLRFAYEIIYGRGSLQIHREIAIERIYQR